MNYSQQMNVRHAAEGGVSAIDCLQLLRSELHFAQGIAITDSKKEKENVKLTKLPNVPALNNQILLQHPE